MIKSDLIHTIVKEESQLRNKGGGITNRGFWVGTSYESYAVYLNDNVDYFYGLVFVVVFVLLLTLTPLLNTFITMSHIYITTTTTIYKTCRTSGTYFGILLLLTLLVLDLARAWLKLTIFIGWVCPTRYRMLLWRYLFPTPNLTLNTGDIMGGGGGGFGFNVAPMIISWVLGWGRGKIEGGIARCVKHAGKIKRRKERKERKERGEKGGG